MQYLLLIYNQDSNIPGPESEEGQAYMKEYYDFTDEVKRRELHLGSNALMPAETATTVRVRDGKTRTTDGPFAETKEQLGGYYLLDCKDLDEAIECASKIPCARGGSIEIRPVMLFD